MASIEIGQLPLTTSVLSSTQIPVENANVTQKIEAGALRDFVVGSALSSLTVSGTINTQNLIASQNLTGTLLTAYQPQITGVGTLANLTTTGNIIGTNIVASGNLYASYVIGNGSLLTGLPAGYTNANVDAYLPTYTGNVAAGNITVTDTFVATGNARVGSGLLVSGQTTLNSTTRVNGNLVAAVETLSVSPTTGALVVAGAGGLGVGGNVNVGGNINVTGNATVNNIAGTKATFTSFQGSGALLTNIPNSALVNSAITVNGSSVSLGGSVTIAGGVVSVTGTAFQVTGNVTQGNILLSLPQSIGTANSVQFGSFGVGTPASGTTGEIRATNNITAFYSSDVRFKENIKPIPDALSKVIAISGKLFDWTDEYLQKHGGADDYFLRKQDFGVVAQDVLEAFPVAVRTRDDGTLAVDYEKLSALAFAAIVELKHQIDQLKNTNGT
jgi:hypothetical protein